MKVAVIGYSGSGKSVLAKEISGRFGLPLLHLDAVHWLPGWEERERGEALRIVSGFMDSSPSWVIDGNYRDLLYRRRLEEADAIVLMQFSRFACVCRVLRRFFEHRGRARDSMAEGCPEKIDPEFLWWVFHKGRSGRRREGLRDVAAEFGDKATVIGGQRELDQFYERLRRGDWSPGGRGRTE